MKWLIVALILLVASTFIRAQSPDETKAWLQSKLNKYQTEFYGVKLKGDCDSYGVFSNFSCKFQNDSLVVTFSAKMLFPNCFVGDKEKTRQEIARSAIIKIPISDIDSISTFDNNRGLRIHTNLSTMRMLATFASGVVESYTDVCSIGFNFKTEDLLFARLQKAFKHLVSFYPKMQTKEAF